MNYDLYLNALRQELVPALGCTEPIAIAFAAAKARQVLGRMPDHASIACSGNIVKNVKAVVVPNSDGMKGLEAAVTLGIVGGNPESGLKVLESVRPEHIAETQQLLSRQFCSCTLEEDADKLYICVKVTAGEDSASVSVSQHHTNITRVERNGKVILEQQRSESHRVCRESMSVDGILEFAKNVPVDQIASIMEQQIACNIAISQAGRKTPYGVQVWRTIEIVNGSSKYSRAIANAVAASEARMCGCPLPVIINSGSGNQGITVSVPVISLAEDMHASQEQLYRALAVSNLVSIHLKSYIGDLSAFCGAVTAACGAAAATAFLNGESRQVVEDTISNTLASVSGIVCDGAKSSCASKIMASLEAAFSGYELAKAGRRFQGGDGIIMKNIEDTIQCVGYIGRCGMDITDREILLMMLNNGLPLSDAQG